MTLKTRRILYTSFIIFFILLSIATITYTAGYRFYFKKQKFQKNGGVFLEFKPKEVDIYINDKFEKSTNFFENSFKMTDLLPGEYTIKIIKNNYHPWEKTIKIKEDKIIFLKDVILFRKNTLPKLTVQKNIINLYPIPYKNKMFLISKDKSDNLSLELYDLNNNKTSNINIKQSTTTDELLILPSTDNDKFLLSSEKKYYVYNINQDKLINLKDKISKEITIENIHWDKNSDIIFFSSNDNKIYELNLFDYNLKEILDLKNVDNLLDFNIIDDKIYLTQEENDEFTLREINKNDFSEKILINNISPNFTFQSSPRPFLSLLDKKNNDLTVINTESEEIILQDQAKNIIWSKKLKSDNYKLAYNNNFEIYIYDFQENEKNLIARYSQKIKEIFWHPSYNYLLFSLNNSLNITDLVKDKKNLNTLFEGENINNITINQKGDKVFFNGKIGNQIGLFELEL